MEGAIRPNGYAPDTEVISWEQIGKSDLTRGTYFL